MKQSLASLFFLIVFFTPASGGTLNEFTSGPWQAGAYSDNDTGSFNHCAASANYRSGIAMIVAVDRDYGWSIGFSSDTWRLVVGNNIPLRFRIDKSPWFDASAVAIRTDQVEIPMKAESTLITLFRSGRTLQIYDGQRSFFFDLTGTSRMVADLAQCATYYVSLENQAGGLAGGSEQKTQPDTTQTKRAALDAELRLEATRLLSNFLLKAGFANTSIVAPTDVPEALKDAHAVAVAGSQIAFAMVVPRETNVSTADITASMIGEMAKECLNQFASGSTRETVEGTEIISGFAACKSAKDAYQLRYVLAPSARGPFLIGLTSELNETLDDATPELPEAEFRQAVYAAGQ